ncbi:hypothetical protein ACNFB1_23445 [Pseudomonas sp. NY15349]|uniref:hypothetical protein n=1 Tax=unclassified Pseudomonas TaxID=196821 RepID=UPI001F35CBAD|nr:hypothetical protein [Pseudomonas sp. LM20]MCE5989120.1 hypothetical protein [Pseudomonas sp. LM20]
MQEESMNELPARDDHDLMDHPEPQETLSRRKRGVAPVVGMACAPEYKLIGDDCVPTNVDFE